MLESYDANDITILIKNDFQNAVVPRPLCLYAEVFACACLALFILDKVFNSVSRQYGVAIV